MQRVFTGFGFGPIQSGLFVREVARSNQFDRIVIAEIDQTLISAVRSNNGCYHINIAEIDGIREEAIEGIEIYDPSSPSDREKLVEAVSLSTEIATSLPSVSAYRAGGISSVSAIIEDGLKMHSSPGTLIYTAENDNHAAEILNESIHGTRPIEPLEVQYLNTVIGKMSGVVSDLDEIKKLGLVPITPGIRKAFLVESFNKILVTRSNLKNFTPGISSFIEKDDLLPFEEAKLYGHNAIHALLAFLGKYRGYISMAEVCRDNDLITIARDAFIYESGNALCKKYASLNDPLFTKEGYSQYAIDLLERMGNPFLGDTVERAGRDVFRKLGPEDRLFGTIKLAAAHGIEAPNMAIGAMAAIAALMEPDSQINLPDHLMGIGLADVNIDFLEEFVKWIWRYNGPTPSANFLGQLLQAKEELIRL